MHLSATIDMSEPFVNLTYGENDNLLRKKKVSLEDFYRALGEVVEGYRQANARVSRIGALPFGFLDGGNENGTMEALIQVPAGVRPIHFMGKTYMVPFPALLFWFKSTAGKIVHSHVYAVNDDSIQADTKLYHYPFGNVYEDGHICWGSNVLKQVECIKDFEAVVELFFGAETNNDLYKAPEIRSGKNKIQVDQRMLIKILADKKKFPCSYLQDAGKVFGSLQ